MKRSQYRSSTNALCERYVERYMPGCVADTVQRWAGVVRKDMFGLVDCVVLRPDLPQLWIQNCSEDTFSSHRDKARASKLLSLIARSGTDFELWEWRKRPHPTNKRKRCWRLRVQKMDAVGEFKEPGQWSVPLFDE